jgi:DNA adenine methylase
VKQEKRHTEMGTEATRKARARKTSKTQTTLLFDDDEIIADGLSVVASPFVKWVGGKRRLLPHIMAVAPKKFKRYLEPFTGGGAVALALGHPIMLLNDANPELMNTYHIVKTDVDSLIGLLDQHTENHSEEYYYQMRDINAPTLSPLEQAARLIYLNKTCFNGLYRVNRQGHFNVPYGKHENPVLYNEERLRTASKALQGATLSTCHYADFLRENAQAGDFIYLDPPYVPVGKFSDFKRYTKEQFREKDQEELASLYTELIERGCHPILSNSWTASELYSDHEIVEVYANRNINKDADGRSAVKEILVVPKVSKSITLMSKALPPTSETAPTMSEIQEA